MRLIDADALEASLGIADEDIIFREMIQDAPTVGDWISVKDRLPEKRGDYLIYNTDGIVWPYWYNPEDKRWYDNCGYLTESVTHWMPLPEPPKKGEEYETDRR